MLMMQYSYFATISPEGCATILWKSADKASDAAKIMGITPSRLLDLDMFNAQQTRSILDLLIGFEISPLLWKSIKPKLSAGRCQSPALRLLYDRENEINNFQSNKFYKCNISLMVVCNIQKVFSIHTILEKLSQFLYGHENVWLFLVQHGR